MFKYRRNIPYVGEEEVEAAAEVIRSGMLVRGEQVYEFENKFSGVVGKKHAVMTNNCTSALQLALEIIDNEMEQDNYHGKSHMMRQVIIPDYTFVATANAVLNMDMMPKVIDINPLTFNMDPMEIPDEYELPQILMPVHTLGNPCKLNDSMELNTRYVIEDAACAVGAEGIGYGDIQCFSFHGSKGMTTGIGGIMTMEKAEWAEYATEMVRAGRPNFNRKAYNFQISNINAAIGLEQLKKLPHILGMRRQWAQRYDNLFRGRPDIVPQATKGSAYQSYVVRVPERIRDQVVAYLRAQSIEACLGTYSLSSLDYLKGDCPVGQQLFKEQICLPLYVQMTEEDQDFIVDQTLKALNKFG